MVRVSVQLDQWEVRLESSHVDRLGWTTRAIVKKMDLSNRQWETKAWLQAQSRTVRFAIMRTHSCAEGVTGKIVNLGQFWTFALKNTHLFSVWMKMRTGMFLFFFEKHLGTFDTCFRDFPASPVVKIPPLQCRGRWHDLVGELRAHIPTQCGQKNK